MRKKRNSQLEFGFQPSNLAVTQEYFARYEGISAILEENPKIVDRVHEDLKRILTRKDRGGRGRKCEFTTDTVLRILVAQIIEGESLRGIVIRIDDSKYLRRFVRIYNGKLVDFTTLCTLKNAIQPKTWKKVNDLLTQAAAESGAITGGRLRLDTTAYETNIHWPTDSGLLWDTYSVLSRLIEFVREIDPEAASDRRLQNRKAKRLHTKIARRSSKKGTVSEKTKSLYLQLIPLVEGLVSWTHVVCERLRAGRDAETYVEPHAVESMIEVIGHYGSLGWKVIMQAQRRVLDGEKVPNDEKIFSIFEPHTELLKRGKAGKPIEFGHMISIQQVEEKFISDYEVFEKKPVDHALVDECLESHRKVFGENPREFSADKGFYESMARIEELEADIEVVSIAKKGARTAEELARESGEDFKLGQRFRAGVEGTISFLKRALGMFRCRNKGWGHYVATVGASVFAHNLLILARSYG